MPSNCRTTRQRRRDAARRLNKALLRMPPTFRKSHEVLLARDAQFLCVLPSTPSGCCCTRQQSTTSNTTQTIPCACVLFWFDRPSRLLFRDRTSLSAWQSASRSGFLGGACGAVRIQKRRKKNNKTGLRILGLYGYTTNASSNLLCDSYQSATKTATTWRQMRTSAGQIGATFDTLERARPTWPQPDGHWKLRRGGGGPALCTET
ncbi:hypothetical protein LX36DRAFT_30642 [Colletotrichum falcatum]|nr:hypothetical protein LX36DRAFT_30642 [Colletotrichum falcatum]